MFEIQWTDEAKATYKSLKDNPSEKARYKAIKKTIKLLAGNPRHPSLQTHPFLSLSGPNGEKVLKHMHNIRHQQHIECFGTMAHQGAK